MNGILPSLQYYLRLLEHPAAFLEHYEEKLRADYESSTDLKDVHLRKWMEMRGGLLSWP